MINREIMTKDPVCCLPTDTVKKAAELMKNGDFGALPVVDSAGNRKIVGIVTDRDIAIKAVAEGKDPVTTMVEGVMNSNVFCVRESDGVDETLSVMSDKQVRRVPVVDEEDCIVGIIAQADIATRLNNPEQAGMVVDEISQATSGVVNQVTSKKNLALVGILLALVVIALVVLNLVGVISIF